MTASKKKRTSFPQNRILRTINRAKEKGWIIKTTEHALELAPTLVIQGGEIDEAVKILDQCIIEEKRDMDR